MKINIHSLSLSVCVALGMGLSLASCSQEDASVPVVEKDASLAVHFTAPSQPGWGVTRAADDSWTDGDGIGIRMVASPDAGTAVYQRYSYSDSSHEFTPASAVDTLYYPADGSDVQFLAFYPYAEVTDNEVTFSVTDQSDEDEIAAIDFMYSALTATEYNKNSTDPVELNEFTHLLSKFTIKVTTPDDATAVDLTDLSVVLTGVPSGYTVALADGSLDISASVAGASTTAPHVDNGASEASFHLMVVPHAYSDNDNAFTDRNLTFTLGVETYTYWLPLETEFVRGEANVIECVLSRDNGEVVLEVNFN